MMGNRRLVFSLLYYLTGVKQYPLYCLTAVRRHQLVFCERLCGGYFTQNFPDATCRAFFSGFNNDRLFFHRW